MQKKVLIQLFLIITIIVVSTIFFKLFFIDPNLKVSKNLKSIENIPINENTNKIGVNQINNITYNAKDLSGNQYTVNSEFGEFNQNSPDIILMTNVTATITLNNSEIITVISKKAIYDSLKYNTNFYDGVSIKYIDNDITSDNFDLYFDKNFGTIFGNVVYKNLNTTLYADKVDLDLITKDSKIYMFNRSKKVKIKSLQ